MSLIDLHRNLAWLVVGANGLAGLWVLVSHWRPNLQLRSMWIAVVAAQASLVFQVVLGVLVRQTTGTESTGLHMFYGFVAFATVGIMYSYRQQAEHYRLLLYGFGGLFLMGLALRSITLI